MFSVILYTLYYTGFQKQAVDLAVKWYATELVESKKSNAGGAFISWQKKYEVCTHCGWPIYPQDLHTYCDEQLRLEIEQDEVDWQQFVADEEARMAQQRLEDEQLEADAAAYYDSRCKQDGCWNEAVKDGYCQLDWDLNNRCPWCGREDASCTCSEQISDPEEYYDDDTCDGICGQPAYACTCAETAAWRADNSGSWFVA